MVFLVSFGFNFERAPDQGSREFEVGSDNFGDSPPSLRTIQNNKHSDVYFEALIRFRFYF